MTDASFRVKETFSIQGRGFVIVGDILDGVIKIGMTLVVSQDEEERRETIRGVEAVDNIRDKKSWTGLVISDPDGVKGRDLARFVSPGTVVRIVGGTADPAVHGGAG